MVTKVLLASTLLLATVSSFTLRDLDFSPSEVDNQKYEKGGGKQSSAAHYSNHGEKGDKAYAGHHQVEKGAQGHHDKQNQQKFAAEEGANKQGHHHQDGYYSEKHQGEKGRKGHHYEDQGSYAKGHSTKGHHNIHKLDEYKKDTEFFDEDHDEAYKEKHGGYEVKTGASAGAHNQGGHSKKVYLDGNYGAEGKFAKGSHSFADSGHKKAEGHDGHYANGAKFAKEGGSGAGKNWGFTRHTLH